jgi:hypothetical protein
MSATISPTESQLTFYKRWLIGRASFDPKDFGVDMDREMFIDSMLEVFDEKYHGMWTVDDLVCRPDDAKEFCRDFKKKHGCPDFPDYLILGSIMNRRKRG